MSHSLPVPCSAAMEWDSESVQSQVSSVFKQPINPEGERKAEPSTPQSKGGVRLHEFVSKTVRITRKYNLFSQKFRQCCVFVDHLFPH